MGILFGCNQDWDQDGVKRRDDCDDRSSLIYPGAPELCDGIDNDCDDLVDEEDTLSLLVGRKVHLDSDGDGFGSELEAVGYCENRPSLDGYIDQGGDCDDADPSIHPDAVEVCDLIDNDCDELIDDDDDSLDGATGTVFYADVDQDSFGDPNNIIEACIQPSRSVENSEDCNDNDYEIRPSTWEDCNDQIDNNCDGFIDAMDSDCVAQNPFNITMLLPGIHENGQTGFAVSSAGDVNGDQWPDALISSPGISNNTGEVALIVSNPILNSGSVYNRRHIFRAAHSFSHTGSDIAALGDWDGDGFDDFIIGADQTGLHETSSDPNPYGAVYAISGREIIPWGVRGLEEAPLQIFGTEHSLFGNTVSGLGDIDGDGLMDFAVGAPTDGTAGTDPTVYLFYGGQNYTVASDADVQIAIGTTPENRLELANIGDVNDDGRSDVLIGGTGLQAHSYLFWGGLSLRNELSMADADLLFIPEDSEDRAHQVASAGDFNNDGISDLFIGAPYNDSNGRNAGEVYVFFGGRLPTSGVVSMSSANVQLFGDQPGQRAGYVHDAGDINGDDQTDLLVGSPGYRQDFNNQGKLYGLIINPLQPYPSPNIEDVATQSIVGPRQNSRWGRKVAYVGDVDRSNFPNILMGEPSTDSPYTDIGQAKLLSLSQFECFDCVEVCDDPLDNDGDGLIGCADPECASGVLCSSPIEDCSDAIDNDGDGGVDCIDPDCARSSECPVNIGIEITGEQTFSRFGFQGSDAGDVDGDGLNDHLFSAPNSSQNGQNNGKVMLYLASTLNTDQSISAQISDVAFRGEDDGDLLGWDLASAGDIDNDGLDDILFSAPRSDRNVDDGGAVYLFLGSSLQNVAVIPTNQADYIFEGVEVGGQAGFAILGNVNLDNDGVGDIVISSLTTNQWDEPIAQSHVIRMGNIAPGTYSLDNIGTVIQSHPLSTDVALQGVHLTNIGDMDGDGRDDIAMGVQAVKTPYLNSGGVYITMASTILIAGDIADWDAHLFGEYEGDQVGFVKSAGDINRDGFNDLLIGMNGNEDKAYIHNGIRIGMGSGGIRTGAYGFDITGEIFETLLDITGDGESDYIFGDGNQLYLMDGDTFPRVGWLNVDFGQALYHFDELGGNVSINSDMNGDGLNDIFWQDFEFNQSRGLVGHIAY